MQVSCLGQLARSLSGLRHGGAERGTAEGRDQRAGQYGGKVPLTRERVAKTVSIKLPAFYGNMMDDQSRQLLSDIAECLECDPRNKSPRIKSGKGYGFRRYLSKYIEEEISVDLREKKVSKAHAISELADFAIDTYDDIFGTKRKFPEEFESQKSNVLSNIFGGEIKSYKFVFPLNLFAGGYLPGKLGKLNKISFDEWKKNYEKPALDQDDTSLEEFLYESPNELEENGVKNEVFTFWTTTYEARDPVFALYEVINQVRLSLAKTNYVLYKGVTDRRESDSSKPPFDRLSPLKEPFLYLIFHNGDYVRYHPMDYDYRRKPSAIRPSGDPFGPLRDLPELSVESLEQESADRGKENANKSLIQAFFAYQDGITESNPRQSFFAFWRGIENLTQVDFDEKSEIVERARSIYNLYQDETGTRPLILEAFEELSDRRNSLAHEGPHVTVSNSHQGSSKILLENLIHLYCDRYDCNYTADDYQIFLQQLTKHQKQECSDDLEKRKREVKIIEDMREYSRRNHG